MESLGNKGNLCPATLPLVTATRVGREVGNGRTRPVILYCDQENSAEEIEVYVKLRGSRELTSAGLMCEGIAALLGRDLGLPVPEPFVVEITDQFVRATAATPEAPLFQNSVGPSFGSKATYPQSVPWSAERVMPIAMRAVAADVFAFDAMIRNPDRRHNNPNCKVRDDELLIYDHDLAFDFLNGVLFWKPPWEPGGLDFLCNRSPARHAFFDTLQGMPHAFDRLVDAWSKIDSGRLDGYVAALPTEWIPAGDAPQRILGYLVDLKSHLPETIMEIRKALH